jgi:hypothetical protein
MTIMNTNSVTRDEWLSTVQTRPCTGNSVQWWQLVRCGILQICLEVHEMESKSGEIKARKWRREHMCSSHGSHCFPSSTSTQHAGWSVLLGCCSLRMIHKFRVRGKHQKQEKRNVSFAILINFIFGWRSWELLQSNKISPGLNFM